VFSEAGGEGVVAAAEAFTSDIVRTFGVTRQKSNGASAAELFDSEGHGFSGYRVHGAETFVVVRPDGFIGAITARTAGVRCYFSEFSTDYIYSPSILNLCVPLRFRSIDQILSRFGS
jgi:hypothetical protein